MRQPVIQVSVSPALNDRLRVEAEKRDLKVSAFTNKVILAGLKAVERGDVEVL